MAILSIASTAGSLFATFVEARHTWVMLKDTTAFPCIQVYPSANESQVTVKHMSQCAALSVHMQNRHAQTSFCENVGLFAILFAIVFSGGMCTAKASPASPNRHRPAVFPASRDRLILIVVSMVFLAVTLAMVMVVFKEEVLEAAVRRKRHCRDAQTREGTLEPVPPAEEACVSPLFAVWGVAAVSPLLPTRISIG